MSNVLHTESSVGWGGQEVRILTEARWLGDRGWRVLIAGQPQSPILAEAGRSGIPVVAVPMRGPWDVAAVARLAAVIRRERLSLVHTHSSVDAWLGGMAARVSGVPVVRSRHVSISIRGRWNPVYSLLADRVVTSGETIRRLLVTAGVSAAKVIAVPAGVDLNDFTPGPGGERVRVELGLTSPVIGSVAMFRGSKGHQYLLEAFEIVLREFPTARLLLVGDGIRRAWVESLVGERKLSRAVMFTGFRPDVPDLLRALDCFVLASVRTEGVPQSLLQALATEIPVVASSVGGVPEVLEHEVTGLLVPSGDPQRLAAALLATLREPELARRRAKAGRELVEARFSRARTVDRMVALYDELLAAWHR
ncbi:MAG: glycosyltransferase family 4 protein [Candidatus Rokubacteria bacterium]|nr:glycosyltransferase family 4 protein [Candidatus Rokubacteria bacterium]